MGDGGVACVPLQQQQHIMERFSIAETALCGGNGNSSGSSNNVFNSKPLKFGETERRKMMKPKRDEFLMKKELVKGELALEREKSSSNSREVENGEIYGDKAAAAAGKEEVEEGELGTLNGEFRVEKTLRSEIEKGEFVPEKWRKGEVERGEFLPGKWRKGNVEKGEIVQEKFGGRRGEHEKGEYGSWRGSKDELEKGEFIPGRWHKGELARDEYGYGKMRRPDSVKDKGWKCDNDYERTPPSGKYNTEDGFQKKDFNRSGSQHNKRFSRLEAGLLDRDSRISSKIVYEENSYKNEHINGKNFERDNSSATRLKRLGADSENSERKHHEYGGGYMGSKIRRLSDDNNRSAHSENYAGRTVERSYRNSSSSSRISSSDRFSSRHYDSSMPSKVVYDKHGRSPGQSERSPRDRARYHDQRDRSPLHRERSPYDWRERSPYDRKERSPYDRKERSPYDRKERSPYDRKESSPFDRSHRFDYRKRSPVNGQRSPLDRARPHDHRDRTPNYFDRSPLDRSRPNTHWEGGRKSSTNEKRYNQHGSKGQEEKINQRDLNSRDSHLLAKESQDRSSLLDDGVSIEKTANNQSPKPEQSQSPSANCEETPQVSGVPEELLSMEEDMDICDTPPHVTMVADSTTGKWFYLDQFGVEQGPSKLCDLRSLVEEGVLVSDHLIKHLDSDRWVTLENAASPLVAVNFPSIVSDAITQLVIPPEAPGNLLADTGDTGQSGNLLDEEGPVTSPQVMCCPHKNSPTLERLEDLHIDERVGVLLKGFTVIPGMELETVGEVLHMTFEQPEWEKWENSEGLTLHCSHIDGQYDKKLGETVRSSEITSKEVTDSRSSALPDKDYAVGCGNSDDWFSGRWSCKGGDWKRNEEASQDRFPRKKLVLNDGFPLCQMPKSGYEDPRWHRKDELYYPSLSKRLDLPSWAFSWTDENDCSSLAKSSQMKPAVVRGPKGTMLPVVRINTCVVKDHGSFVSESRARIRGRDRYSSRSARPYSASNDIPRSSAEDASSSRTVDELDSQGSRMCTAPINYPKDRLCTADDLQLHLGDWYYLDGAGHERGPSSLSELQTLVDQGNIQKYSSIFRKIDNVWIPVSSAAKSSAIAVKTQEENNEASSYSFGPPPGQLPAFDVKNSVSSSFHSLHPQFIGYTCGKLHELVMKSYKSREFAAAVNEVLDPWISAKQPKKEMEKLIFNLAFNKVSHSSNRFCRSEGGGGKRARMASDENDEDYEMEEDLMTAPKDDFAFEDLCDNVSFKKEDGAPSEAVMGSWGLLDGHMLARVFHFLRADLKSLAFAALTCKHWRSAVKFYKDISRQVDLSSVGPSCTDSMIWNIMNGYNGEKITSMILIGCTSITSTMLEEILRSFPSLSSVDVRGCSQFGELTLKIPNVNWIKSRIWHGNNIIEDSHSKTRSLKQITEKTSAISTSFKGVGGHMDDFDQLRDYFDSVDRRESANQLFHRSLYRRSKVFDARKSSSILSRDARLRRWTIKKSENWYKKMEEFLALGLKDIMKENTFDFFLPKVAEIEDRMKNGYYVGRGLSSVKEDISRMCRDAIKAKSRGDAGDMNHIVTLFIQLATRLEESSKSLNQRDNMIKTLKEDSPAAFGSATSKYKKKLNKVVTERKYVNRINGASFVNGGPDSEYASDREIRRRLSKLNRKSMDSGSETSDDTNRSSENDSSESESTASDTESDLEFRSEGGTGESRVDGYTTVDDGLESMTDEREWGARMTKASLVPPVTRKYEVIDHYVIVADEEEVRRKMRVSLPEDYAEKISQQKNGIEDADMEIPEVKDYKPRKQLGDEVLEQEVYGIDPYTHNLLLDSMQEFDWPLLEKHLFIEDVLLCTLNKQVRHFTGTGNTPMVYTLQPVIEDVQRNAEEASDIRTMRMCQGLLKAITGRPDDNYVAYRKGLGVVCNKEGGFGTEDFVVEFLGEVYPTWKWFEKQDGIRSLQKNSKDPAPEFYNIYLERPKGDADGYDLVVVDAMHKANYASRICHSCRPNCEAKVTAVDGHYQIGIYAVRQIQHGEEITFDYNSVTESKEEYEASVCLCGSQVCRGSYLNLTGEGAFQKVLKEWHGILDRHQLMIEACELNSVSEEDYIDLGRAGLGSCLLGGLPDWLIAYTARLVRFINFERTKLPEEILKHNLEEKRKYFADISLEVEKSDAEVQAEGVYNQRLQNLALTLDKVRYVMRCVYGDPKKAPPPLERLSPQDAVSFLWKGEGSLVKELLQCMAPHMDDSMLNDLKSKIHAHDPTGSDDIQKELQKSLLWLRDEVRNLPCTYKCRHDAAADLIHIHAYTKSFFRIREYKTITSPPVFISPLDMGPKYTDKLGGLQEYCKTYGENYCLGQLIFWHNQTYAEPDCNLARSTRGCLSLPDIGSFYAKVQIPSRQRVYGPRTVKFMLARMEKQSQRPWPKDRIWSFKSSPRVFGSPMLDSALSNSSLNKEMVHWLKNRPAIFQAMWDR